jgi:hypothetical protein
MNIFSPDKIRSLSSTGISIDFPQGRKPDLRKVGRDIYEVLTNTGRHGYKQRMRKRTIKIDQEQNYAPSEVAAILNVSYDAALRLMQKMKGVVNLGTPTRRYKQGKKKLRISGIPQRAVPPHRPCRRG